MTLATGFSGQAGVAVTPSWATTRSARRGGGRPVSWATRADQRTREPVAGRVVPPDVYRVDYNPINNLSDFDAHAGRGAVLHRTAGLQNGRAAA